MRKISLQWQIRYVILTYCLIITSVFAFLIIRFQLEIRSPNIESFMDTMIVDSEYYNNNMTPDIGYNFEQKTKDEIILYRNLSSYSSYYNQQILKKLIPLTFVIAIILIISSFILWLIIKKLQIKDSLQLAKKFENIKYIDESPQMDDAMMHAFLTIKDEYTKHMEEYQRLHSYLSHEQKNAIALLRNNLDLQHFDRCEKNIDYLANSIDDILTLSDANDDSHITLVDVLLVCASVCDSYAMMHENITFTFDDDEAFVLGKERWIYRAISNILDNAIKYGKDQPIDVSLHVQNNSVIVKIKDHGIGICEAKQKEIFEHRYRINELNKDGYGIGLSLVSHVCDLCDGYVALESELDKGTTFYLSFPSAKKITC